MADAQTLKCSCGQAFKEPAPWSNANCFVIVTGASRGFGRAFCVQLMKELAEPRTTQCPPALSITFFLLGRDVKALCETESEIISSIPENGQTSVTVYFAGGEQLDLSKADANCLSQTLQPISDAMQKATNQSSAPQWNLLVNNAGTVGDVQHRADEHLSAAALDAYFRINLVSQMLLTSVFLRMFAPMPAASTAGVTDKRRRGHQPTTVLTISSLAAVKPLSHMATYCAAKAARDMHIRCLALDRPTVSTFVYSPGPLATAMYDELERNQGDPATRALFKERREQGLIVQPAESARVCIRWLRRQRFLPEGAIVTPARVCPLHQADYTQLWKGLHLDYFEARDLDEVEFNRIRP